MTAKRDIQAMVETAYNHPSVVLYSTGNEITETGTKKGIQVTGQLRDWIRQVDTSRPVTCAINPMVTMSAREPKTEEPPVDYTKLTPRTGERNFKEEFTGSKAFNVMMNYTKSIMALLINTKKVDDAIAPIAERSDIAGYNYSVGRYGKDEKRNPDRLVVGTETTSCDVDMSWQATCRHPNVVGDFTWTAVDHLGESGIGYMSYTDSAFYKDYPYRINGSGILDINLGMKPMAYYTQIVYGTRTEPYIVAEPYDHAGQKASNSSYQFTNGVHSWDWEGCEGKKAKVYVFSDAPKVELCLNGKKLGVSKKKKRPFHVFTVAFAPGKLEAVALDESGSPVGHDVLQTSGKE